MRACITCTTASTPPGPGPIRSHPEGVSAAGLHPSSLSKPLMSYADLDAVVLTVAVGVFPQRHIPQPMPAVLDRPARQDCLKHGLGASAPSRWCRASRTPYSLRPKLIEMVHLAGGSWCGGHGNTSS